jgi:hypothetical protein
MATTAAIDFITDGFPAPGLRPIQRLITGHKEDGKGYFLVTDTGDHHRVMGQNQAVANILYSTAENPVDLNEEKDIKYAHDNEVFLPPPPQPKIRIYVLNVRSLASTSTTELWSG